MTAGQARDAARRWMAEEGRRVPGFCAAYTAGSTNWLEDDTELPAGADLDVMLVVEDEAAGGREKFLYGGVLLEVSRLGSRLLAEPERVLSDYQLAPSLYTARMVMDPAGFLDGVRAALRRDYASEGWVRRRCADAMEKARGHLRRFDERAPVCQRAMACLFAAGVTTHVLLAAGLRNPTVRTRYVAVRELLAGEPGFHEKLLELLGAARISRETAARHLETLEGEFDAAAGIETTLPFAPDLKASASGISIDGSREMIERGWHREAMFWIAVTHSRCRQVLGTEAACYAELLRDLGLATVEEQQRRCAEIERALPQVAELAERLAEPRP